MEKCYLYAMKHLILGTIAILLLACVVTTSCRNAETIPIINLNKIDQSTSLDLNDLLTDISQVQISADFLLSMNDQIYVTPRYLIIYMDRYGNRPSLHLFSRSGEHIQKLAEKGNGPGEFYSIEDFFVDEDESTLYYVDMKDRTSLFRIDIHSGAKLDPLSIDFSYLTTKYINGSVYSFPNYMGNFDQINKYTDSSIIALNTCLPSQEVQKYKGGQKYPFLVLGSTITSYLDEITLVNFGYSDTLFFLQNNKLVPLCILHLNNKMTDYQKGGSVPHLISAYNNGIVLSKTNFEYKINERAQVLIYTTEYYVLYDRKDAVYKIDNIHIYDTTINLTNPDHNFKDFSTFPATCGKFVYMMVGHDVLKTRSAGFDSTNDNPIIIVGALR